MIYENINQTEIGKTLRELRGTRKLQEVSDGIDISASALAMYESGQRMPRDEIKIRLANYYQVPVEAIFYPQKQHATC